MLTLLEKNSIDGNLSEKDAAVNKSMTGVEFIIYKIKTIIAENGSKIILLKSGTGTGKSTVLPPKLYEYTNGHILICQPTVSTATSLPEDIIKYSNKKFKMEENIGYTTGPKSRKPKTGLEFCTYGILSHILKNTTYSDLCKKYSAILIDEAHSRSMAVDYVMAHIKKIAMRDDSPIFIFMSGTLDETIFKKYFALPDTNVITVKSGGSFPIEERYPTEDITDVTEYISKTIQDIHFRQSAGDILVFTYGIKQMSAIESKVRDINLQMYVDGTGETYGYLLYVPTSSADSTREDIRMHLTSSKPVSEYTMVLKENLTVKPSRRVFVATNAVETGLTIDSLRYCVDTGMVREVSFSPVYKCPIGTIRAVPKSSVIQRRGRVGRVGHGVWYPCYPKEVFDSMSDGKFPEVATDDFSGVLLDLLGDNIHVSSLIQPPPVDMLMYAFSNLMAIGFIQENLELTKYGQVARKFRKMTPNQVAALLYSYRFKCPSEDIATLLAFMSQDMNMLVIKKLPRNEYVYQVMYLWNELINTDDIRKFCKKVKISVSNLIDILKTREEIINNMVANDLKVNPFDAENLTRLEYFNALKMCFYYAYPGQVCRRTQKGQMQHLYSNAVLVGNIDADIIVAPGMSIGPVQNKLVAKPGPIIDITNLPEVDLDLIL